MKCIIVSFLTVVTLLTNRANCATVTMNGVQFKDSTISITGHGNQITDFNGKTITGNGMVTINGVTCNLTEVNGFTNKVCRHSGNKQPDRTTTTFTGNSNQPLVIKNGKVVSGTICETTVTDGIESKICRQVGKPPSRWPFPLSLVLGRSNPSGAVPAPKTDSESTLTDTSP